MKQVATKPKSTTKKSNAVVGASKSNRTIKIVAFSAIAVLVLGMIGFLGYGKYHAYTLKAHAANYAKLLPGDQQGHQIYACKYSTPWGYGLKLIGEQPGPEVNNSFSASTVKSPSDAGHIIDFRVTRTFWDGKIAAFNIYTAPDGWFWTQIDGHSAWVAVGYTPYC